MASEPVRSVALFVILLGPSTLALLASEACSDELPRGAIIPRVECRHDPQYSYSIYLPTTYLPERKWPVVYCFSPGGDGVRPLRLLQPAAETYGYILIGSNDARNGPWEPVHAAQRALWHEVNARFAVDPRRSYATGFSGGSRAAVEMALSHERQFAGLILAGAAFSPQTPYPRRSHLAVYALVGDGDLNLAEHLKVEQQLQEKGYVQWLEVFEGGHRWPSAARFREAVALLEVAAMKRGLRALDETLVARLASERLAAARCHRESGRLLLALRGLRQTAEHFTDTPSGREAAAEAKTLAQDPRLAERQQAEDGFVEDILRLQRYSDFPAYREAVDRLTALMNGGGPLATRARLCLHLHSVFLEQGGIDLLQRGLPEEAIPNLTVAAAVYPGNASAAYNAACALALTGKPEQAIERLRSAAEHGFNRVELLDSDADLASIRGRPELSAIRERVVLNHEKGLKPESYPFAGEDEP
jgi:tetratricopeptide (TPR) repeat protein